MSEQKSSSKSGTLNPCKDFTTDSHLLIALRDNISLAFQCLLHNCKSILKSLRHRYYYLPEWEVEEMLWSALSIFIEKLHAFENTQNTKSLLRKIANDDIIDNLIRKRLIKYDENGKKTSDNNPKNMEKYSIVPKFYSTSKDNSFESYFLENDIYAEIDYMVKYKELLKTLSKTQKAIVEDSTVFFNETDYIDSEETRDSENTGGSEDAEDSENEDNPEKNINRKLAKKLGKSLQTIRNEKAIIYHKIKEIFGN